MDYEPLEEYKFKLEDLSLNPKKTFQKICCPSCNSNVAAENININDKIAKCNSCHVVFPFQNDIEELLNPQLAKQEVIRPEGIELFKYKDEIDITVDQPPSVFEALAILIFLPLIIFFCFMFYYKQGFSPIWTIGSGLFWILALANSFYSKDKNKIYITIDDKFMDIKWRPKKFVKDVKYNVDEIDQIYTKSGVNGNGVATNGVFMIVNGVEGQKHIKLMVLHTLSKARYIEQEIERYLGIVDREIPEEKI